MPRIGFFFNDTATAEIYTLSLHDALPISLDQGAIGPGARMLRIRQPRGAGRPGLGAHAPRGPVIDAGIRLLEDDPGIRPDRKSTRLYFSHQVISYSVFCLDTKLKYFVAAK